MVKRKVKLAQIVCAVYSLNKPNGASKKEIVRFCKYRFGCTCNSKEIERILERGLDEGLLTCFRKRYQVTKLRYAIVWSAHGGTDHTNSARRRRRKKKNKKSKLSKKSSPKRRTKAILKNRVILEDCVKKTSSLYKLWKKEFKRQIQNMKTSMRKISKRGKDLCKKPLNGGKPNLQSLKQKVKVAIKSNRRKIDGMKKSLKLKRSLKQLKKGPKRGQVGRIKKVLKFKRSSKEQKTRSRVGKGGRKKRGRQHASSSDSIENENHDERYRSLLRQTKHAVVHGKSWDKLNFTRQRRMRENQEMVKNSQLIQKILTQKHAASWDNLNSKLKHMKESASCIVQEGRANGDGADADVDADAGPSHRSLTSL